MLYHLPIHSASAVIPRNSHQIETEILPTGQCLLQPYHPFLLSQLHLPLLPRRPSYPKAIRQKVWRSQCIPIQQRRVNIDIGAARLSTPPLIPTGGLIAMASTSSPSSLFGCSSLSQGFFLLRTLAEGNNCHNQLANWNVALG